jgi:hypothetical protein
LFPFVSILRQNRKTVLSFQTLLIQTIMKRLPLITVLILLLLFALAIFFYFSLGSQPKIVGEEDPDHVPNSELESTIKNNSEYASYVYVSGVGYVLKDRRIVLLVGKDTSDARQAEAIKNVEKDLESYWKWRILTGDRKIEDLTSKANQTYSDRKIGGEGTGEEIPRKGFFSRILDVFKVANAVIVVQDNAKKCDCDNDLLLLSGPDLHLMATTLNPDGPAAGMGGTAEFNSSIIQTKSLKLPQTEPQSGDGNNASLLVGIIDSGLNNEKLIASKLDNILNYNFLSHTSDVTDSFMHGTEIARIIAKETNGVNISMVGLKTFDNKNVGNLYDNLCAILYSIKNNIKIVNASWGTFQKQQVPIFDEVLRRAKTANMVVICSAGNKKVDIDIESYYPACYADNSEFGSHLITVTSKYDSVVCQNFSSSGTKIDLTYKSDTNCYHLIPNSSDSGSFAKPGTSYATPYVTADVIKYLQTHTSGFSKSGYIGSIPASSPIKQY